MSSSDHRADVSDGAEQVPPTKKAKTEQSVAQSEASTTVTQSTSVALSSSSPSYVVTTLSPQSAHTNFIGGINLTISNGRVIANSGNIVTNTSTSVDSSKLLNVATCTMATTPGAHQIQFVAPSLIRMAGSINVPIQTAVATGPRVVLQKPPILVPLASATAALNNPLQTIRLASLTQTIPESQVTQVKVVQSKQIKRSLHDFIKSVRPTKARPVVPVKIAPAVPKMAQKTPTPILLAPGTLAHSAAVSPIVTTSGNLLFSSPHVIIPSRTTNVETSSSLNTNSKIYATSSVTVSCSDRKIMDHQKETNTTHTSDNKLVKPKIHKSLNVKGNKTAKQDQASPNPHLDIVVVKIDSNVLSQSTPVSKGLTLSEQCTPSSTPISCNYEDTSDTRKKMSGQEKTFIAVSSCKLPEDSTNDRNNNSPIDVTVSNKIISAENATEMYKNEVGVPHINMSSKEDGADSCSNASSRTQEGSDGGADVKGIQERIDGSAPMKKTQEGNDVCVDNEDPMSLMQWENGVASLPGSDLKFRLNEFGIYEMITNEPTFDSEPKNSDIPRSSDPIRSELCNKAVKIEDVKPEISSLQHASNVTVHNDSDPDQAISHGVEYNSGDVNPVGTVKCESGARPQTTTEGSTQAVVSEASQDMESQPVNDVKHGDISLECTEKLPDDRRAVGGAVTKRCAVNNDPAHKLLLKKRGRKPMMVKDLLTKRQKKSVSSTRLPQGFSWTQYLEQQGARGAPSKLFKQAYPQVRNNLKTGMKLEGVSPHNQSVYSVLTVAETRGFRVRLHVDDMSEMSDFWLNADSAFFFPVGWCEKNAKALQSPKGYCSSRDFNWSYYLRENPAPIVQKYHLIQNTLSQVTPSSFRVGHKLEAVDKKNSTFICVATVADCIGDQILVHFDGWESTYDYWCEVTSPYIHPVGWCHSHNVPLTQPPDWNEEFYWDSYLQHCHATAVPARAFKPRDPMEFEVGTRVEIVDKRNPILIRVATIVNVLEYRVKVHFDGWDEIYDYWVDDDSPDLHPPGWCARTHHPLMTPLTPRDLVVDPGEPGCPTPGCKGIGHIKGARYTGHHSAFGCPYSPINLQKENENNMLEVVDVTSPLASKSRLSPQLLSDVATSECRSGDEYSAKTEDPGQCTPPDEAHSLVARIVKAKRGRKPKSFLHWREKKEKEEKEKETMRKMHLGIHQSVFMATVSPTEPANDLPFCWDEHTKLLPGVNRFDGSEVSQWNVEQVAVFIRTLLGSRDYAQMFREQQIDGEAFLLLTQTDLVNIMKVKLGPAVKIYNSVIMFKTSVDV